MRGFDSPDGTKRPPSGVARQPSDPLTSPDLRGPPASRKLDGGAVRTLSTTSSTGAGGEAGGGGAYGWAGSAKVGVLTWTSGWSETTSRGAAGTAVPQVGQPFQRDSSRSPQLAQLRRVSGAVHHGQNDISASTWRVQV